MTAPEHDYDDVNDKRQRAEQTLLQFISQIEKLNGHLARAIPVMEKTLPILQAVSLQMGVSLKKMKGGGTSTHEGLKDAKDLVGGVRALWESFRHTR